MSLDPEDAVDAEGSHNEASSENPFCERCNVTMEPGHVVAYGHGNQWTLPFWQEGAPEFGIFGNLVGKGKARYGVATYRCPQCHKLEMYTSNRMNR